MNARSGMALRCTVITAAAGLEWRPRCRCPGITLIQRLCFFIRRSQASDASLHCLQAGHSRSTCHGTRRYVDGKHIRWRNIRACTIFCTYDEVHAAASQLWSRAAVHTQASAIQTTVVCIRYSVLHATQVALPFCAVINPHHCWVDIPTASRAPLGYTFHCFYSSHSSLFRALNWRKRCHHYCERNVALTGHDGA